MGIKIHVLIVIASVWDVYFGAPALTFSTLLEVTEVVTMHVLARCTRPTSRTPLALSF